jgi:NADH-quinone oxidoreductase subunit G
MDKLISLKIDGRAVSVPEGTLIVDAAKMAGITFRSFATTPRWNRWACAACAWWISAVPMVDRATGQPVLNEDGTPKISFRPQAGYRLHDSGF